MPVHDLGFFFDWLIVDVVLHEPRVFDPINLQVCDPARPTTVVSGGPGRRRWEFMRLPHETLDELNDERRAWELLERWDVHPDNATLERHAVYTFNARYAEQWRRGRVLLAGDAAHQMPPFAGQGMCAGSATPPTSPGSSTSSSPEPPPTPCSTPTTRSDWRAPAKRSSSPSSWARSSACPTVAEAAAHDEAMAATVGPEPIDVPDLPGPDSGVIHRLPARRHLFVQGIVGGCQRSTTSTEPDGGSSRPSPEPCGSTPTSPAGSRDRRRGRPRDRAGIRAHGRWFAEHGARCALQRPDFHLYGTATGPAGAATLLADLREHAGNPDPTLTGGVHR